MANLARKSLATDRSDTADILAAVQDLGDRMERRFGQVEAEQRRQGDEQRRQGDVLGKLDERQRKQGEDSAEMKGRFTGIEAQIRQIPTSWTISALIFTIFGASFALIRYAVGH